MAIPTKAATATGSGSASLATDLTGLTVVSGKLVVLLVSQTGGARTLTVTDSDGDTWTSRQDLSNSRRAHILTCIPSVSGTKTITTTFSVATSWQAYAAAMDDADGGLAFDTSDNFANTGTTSCFAAASTALDTAANVIVFSVYAAATITWTESKTLISKGTGYLFQETTSAGALTDERSPATASGTASNAAASISIKGGAGGGGGQPKRTMHQFRMRG